MVGPARRLTPLPMFVVTDDTGERGRVFVGELTRPPGPVYIEPDPEPEAGV